MKKTISILISLTLLLLLFAGCETGGDIEPTPEPIPTPIPTPTAEPTPTPEPRILFAGEDWIADGVDALLAEDGIVPERFDSVDQLLATGSFAGLTIAALYQDAPLDQLQIDELAEKGIQAVLFDSSGGAAPAGMTAVPFSGADKKPTPAMILDELLIFPPHDAPVRLFGMFAAEGSAAHRAWTTNVEAGKLLAKDVYVKGDEKTPEEWAERLLKDWLPGTADGVYCETVEMAEVFVRAMAALERVDMEVFCVEQNADWFKLQLEFPKLAVCSFQPNAEEVMAYMADFIRAALAQAPIPVPPSVTEDWRYTKPNTL